MPPGAKLGSSRVESRQIIGNILTALIEHGRVHTTPSKAKIVQPLMDNLIAGAKKGTVTGAKRARRALYSHEVSMPKLYTTLKDRFQHRNGGFTRIILNGTNNRRDGAPSAILELVDSPGDFKFELTARELGRRVFEEELSTGMELPIMYPKILNDYKNYFFNQKIKSVLAYRGPEARVEFIEKAEAFRELLRSESPVYGGMLRRDREKFKNEPMRQAAPTVATERTSTTAYTGRVHRNGELLPAMAIETPRKPVPYADRHLWARKPAFEGGRGGFVDTWPTDEDGNVDKSGRPLSTVGAGWGESKDVGGVDGVEEGKGWQNGGNGEHELGRTPLQIVKGSLGKRRVPVPRLERGGDGMGG